MTTEEKRRYSRQISVEEIGESGQARLLASKVAIVGCGALGTMVAMQLAAAGVGSIVIADFDTIDISNLQRQYFFKTEEAGASKADTLALRMTEINPDCKVEIVKKMIDRKLASEIFKESDFIIDATDNPASKMMIEETCEQQGKYCCVAGVSGYHGQVMTIRPGGAKFGEVFSQGADSEFMPCSIAGVIGPTAALCASIQAAEAIKFLTNAGVTLQDRLLTFNLFTNSFNLLQL